jgi:hypothetical protein
LQSVCGDGPALWRPAALLLVRRLLLQAGVQAGVLADGPGVQAVVQADGLACGPIRADGRDAALLLHRCCWSRRRPLHAAHRGDARDH